MNSLYLLAVGPDWLVSWLTPLWTICLGALLGLTTLLILWGIAFLVAPKLAKGVPLIVSEGPLLPIVSTIAIAALLSVPGAFVVRKPLEMIDSIARLPFMGERTISAVVPADAQRAPVPFGFRGGEIVAISMASDGLVEVADAELLEDQVALAVEIGPGLPEFKWERRQQLKTLYGEALIENLYFTNLSGVDANVTVTVTTGPAYAEVSAIPITTLSVIVLVLLYVIQATVFPRVSAIALSTSKSELAQPLFWILASVGVALLILFLFLPYNTFGEDIKMLKDSSLTLIMVMGIIQGVWAASNSVADEIEGRTALTVLSKPIGRRQFIFGKVLGILWTVFLLFLVLGIALVVVVSYKPVYDAREMGSETPEWTLSHLEVMLTIPGLVLAFFEATVMVCLSVAISTRLPMLANFVICFTVYVLGHITPLIVQSNIQFAPVKFIGQLIATILPVLDHFNIQAAVAAGRAVPYHYLGWALVYCLLYSGIALVVALALFEDRDLA